MTLPELQRLEAWMREVTDAICYQPEIPLDHKKEVAEAMNSFSKEIDANRQRRKSGEVI